VSNSMCGCMWGWLRRGEESLSVSWNSWHNSVGLGELRHSFPDVFCGNAGKPHRSRENLNTDRI
jgi:hypothetical protein